MNKFKVELPNICVAALLEVSPEQGGEDIGGVSHQVLPLAMLHHSTKSSQSSCDLAIQAVRGGHRLNGPLKK